MADVNISETAKIKKLVYAETSRVRKTLKDAGICQKNMELLRPIIQNVATMKVKLDIARKQLLDEDLTIEYSNGGGQSGTRENPALSAYEGLWKSYMQGMNKIFDVIQGKDAPQETPKTEKKTVLELVKEKRKKEA
jgi:hypothetical protein